MPYENVMQIREEDCSSIRPQKKTLRAGTVDAFRGSWHSRQYLTKLSLGGRI